MKQLSFLFVTFLSVAAFASAVDTSIVKTLEKQGFVTFHETNFLTADEISSAITHFEKVNSVGVKANAKSNAATQFFLFSMHDGVLVEDLTPSFGEILDVPNDITKIASRLLEAVNVDDEKCLIEAVLVDNFKIKGAGPLPSFRVAWHRDTCAGSCHPLIAVFCLETKDIPKQNYLLATFNKQVGGILSLNPAAEFPVIPGSGFIADETFYPHVYHATTKIKKGSFGEAPSRKSLIFRIVNKNSPSYKKMKEYYRSKNCYTHR